MEEISTKWRRLLQNGGTFYKARRVLQRPFGKTDDLSEGLSAERYSSVKWRKSFVE